jgi:hypothetical protein
MKGPALLASHAGHLRTRVGACWPGSRAVFRGMDLHRDLDGIDWLELYLFGLTGRRFDAPQLKLLHGIWAMTSYPDTRLWNNRVGALAASARSSSVLGLAAAIAVTEAGIYGGGPGIRAIDFFLRTAQALDGGAELEQVVADELVQRRILGYGRPIDSNDERLPSLVALAHAQGLDGGRHYRLAFAVQEILVRHKPFLKMNFAALTAALAADLGFTPREYHLFNILKTLAGIPPCIVEAAEKPAGALFPTPCSGIAYEGVARRTWRS